MSVTKSDVQKWYEACAIINPKYNNKTDAYDFLQNNSSRVIQLSTVAKLTTDNNSVISDFPIDYDTKGMEPYNEYVIKVCDTYDAVLYIFVHHKSETTYLLPVVSGFDEDINCSTIRTTDNWRTRAISANYIYKALTASDDQWLNMCFDFLDNKNRSDNAYIMACDAEREFGIEGTMLVVDNSGTYGDIAVFSHRTNKNLLKVWYDSEKESLTKGITTFSLNALVLQVWLHTVCMWRKRCLSRQIKVIGSNGHSEYKPDIRQAMNAPGKQVIVDINKDIVVYQNDGLSKREFRGYHMYQSDRCGHFRHLKDKVIYIPPTTVHYKKLVPDLMLQKQGAKTIIYRNTEDFLREKSYLENDVLQMLKAKGIKYKREQMFSWMGKKRLDFYLPDENIAIECQGVQHFYKYGANDKDLKNRQKRDEDKYNECRANGIEVLYFMSDMIPVPEEIKAKHTYITDLEELLERIRGDK